MWYWFNGFFLHLKESQVNLLYRFDIDDGKEYQYFLNDDIKEWLKENNIQYKFKSKVFYSYSAPFKDYNVRICFRNNRDTILFKLTW
jgi:hypothetical protein